jgi:hypothetical protein
MCPLVGDPWIPAQKKLEECRMKSLIAGIFVLLVVVAVPGVFAQQNFGMFIGDSYGCHDYNDTAQIAYLQNAFRENEAPYKAELKNRMSLGLCTNFAFKTGLVFLNEPSKIVRSVTLVHVRNLSDKRDWWVPGDQVTRMTGTIHPK